MSKKGISKPSLADFCACLVAEVNTSSFRIEKEGQDWVISAKRRGDRPSLIVKDPILASAMERVYFELMSWREGK